MLQGMTGASRGMVSLSQSDITPRNIYGSQGTSRSSTDSYGFPSTHSTHSSISSGSYGPNGYYAGEGSVTDYSSASESVDLSSSRTLPRPNGLLGGTMPPAPQSMMSQFSSGPRSGSPIHVRTTPQRMVEEERKGEEAEARPAGEKKKLPIAPQVHRCLIEFQKACDNLNRSEPHIKLKIPTGAILDQLGRFRLWCGNVGAHRHGKASFVHKLREASHISGQVLELLQNLETILEEANEILTGERISAEDLLDSDSEASEDGQDSFPKESTTTELEQLACNLAETNTCLMRLSMAIRNPAPHDQFKQSRNIGVTHFESSDIDHVRVKFPLARVANPQVNQVEAVELT
jgi:hypothetical protein